MTDERMFAMEEREEIITLIDEEGEHFDFMLIDYFQVDNLDYVVLLPCGGSPAEFEAEEYDGEDTEPAEDAGDAVIFRVIKGNNGETALHTIEDEDEWDKVVEIACERLLSLENWEESRPGE